MTVFDLPVDDNVVTILGILASMELSAARELETFLDNKFKAAGKPEWFEDIRHYRFSNHHPFPYQDPRDLRFILNEACLADSQIWHLIPNVSQMWFNSANKLRSKLNLMHHQQLRPDLMTLKTVATLFDLVGSPPGLEVGSWAKAVVSRVNKILDGTFVNESPPEQEPQKATPKPDVVVELETKYGEVQRERLRRPPWGSRWVGPKPDRKLVLDRRTREIYDSNGISVSAELGTLQGQVIDMWLNYFPLGGEVWVDEDGATMAYVRGDATMIGWFGPTPDDDSDKVRGYVLDREHQYQKGDIYEMSSGLSLRKAAAESVEELLSLLSDKLQEETILSVTDYGDLFIQVSEGDGVRLAHVHKNIWFPGHLPG